MHVLTVEAFGAWLGAYGAASRDDDARASAALFATDARYHESPFAEPVVGREAIERYWAEGGARYTDKQSTFEVLAVHGRRGIARWRSSFTVRESGERYELDCLFVAEFAEDGTCEQFREWWHAQPADVAAGAGSSA